ncbi:hypothetical protein K1719_009733 [Acacia pycnantha]|nr:hypothetical protein K1719_009733 [Acacia pycnantha]
MTDSYWNRQQAMQQAMQPTMLPSSAMLKRPRTEYEMSTSGMATGNEMQGYVARDDDRTGSLAIKDTKMILSAYDRYLQSAQLPSYNSGEASTMGNVGMSRPVVSTMPGHSPADPSVMRRPGSGGHDLAPKGRNLPLGWGRFGSSVGINKLKHNSLLQLLRSCQEPDRPAS